MIIDEPPLIKLKRRWWLIRKVIRSFRRELIYTLFCILLVIAFPSGVLAKDQPKEQVFYPYKPPVEEVWAEKPTIPLTEMGTPEKELIAAQKRKARISGSYAYGNCTWGVAKLTPVPTGWGNAINWYANAKADGFTVGSIPKVGSVMVTRESGYGHVALVTAVNGSSFTVKEMNYAGFGVYSSRTISPGSIPLVGFIYL